MKIKEKETNALKLDVREASCFFLLCLLLVMGNPELRSGQQTLLWQGFIGSLVIGLERIAWDIKFQGDRNFEIIRLLGMEKQSDVLKGTVLVINSMIFLVWFKYVSVIQVGVVELFRILNTGKILTLETPAIMAVSIYTLTLFWNNIIRRKNL